MDKDKLRPVVVTNGTYEGTKGFFHCFGQFSDVITTMVALIEFEDGQVADIEASWIKFTDR